MSATTTARRRVLRVPVSGTAEHRADLLAVEEPLEIRVDGEPLTVTMRTPGHDIDLAAGFLFTEGLLGRLDEVQEIRMCDANVAAVTVRPGAALRYQAADSPRRGQEVPHHQRLRGVRQGQHRGDPGPVGVRRGG